MNMEDIKKIHIENINKAKELFGDSITFDDISNGYEYEFHYINFRTRGEINNDDIGLYVEIEILTHYSIPQNLIMINTTVF